MRAAIAHDFSQVGQLPLPVTRFDRSHRHKTTLLPGYLVPVLVDDLLPGDHVDLSCTYLLRLLGALKQPIMDDMWLDMHAYIIPYRLVWTNFVKQQGEQTDPDDTIDYLQPVCPAPEGGYDPESLQDYLGVPPGIDGFSHVNTLARAYNLIWNQHYRAQLVDDSVVVDLDDGPDDPADYVLLRRRKRHDMYTSAAPEPQRGDPVQISLGSSAPVQLVPHTTSTNPMIAKSANDGSLLANQNILTEAVTAYLEGATAGENAVLDPNGRYFANLSLAEAVTISDLRDAIVSQHVLEQDARAGTRYQEILAHRWHTNAGDARLQRAEYIGGWSFPLSITQVPQTSGTDTTAQAGLAAYSVSAGGDVGIARHVPEDSLLMVLASIRADLTYQQGLPPIFSRRTRYDRPLPELFHISEQPLYNRELYLTGSADPDDLIFGYQEPWSDYRYKQSLISGLLRSDVAGTLDVFTLSQDFAATPGLDSTFLEEDPPVSRVVALSVAPRFILDIAWDYKHTRQLPFQSVPGVRRI